MCRKPLAEVRPSLEKKLREAAGTDVYVWYNYAAGDEQTVRPRFGIQTPAAQSCSSCCSTCYAAKECKSIRSRC
jgi:hypothetical protein